MNAVREELLKKLNQQRAPASNKKSEDILNKMGYHFVPCKHVKVPGWRCRECASPVPDVTVPSRPESYNPPAGPSETPPGISKPQSISVFLDSVRDEEDVIHSFARKPFSTSGKIASTTEGPPLALQKRSLNATYYENSNFIVFRYKFKHFVATYTVRKSPDSEMKRKAFYARKCARTHSKRKEILKKISLFKCEYHDISTYEVNSNFRFLLKPIHLTKVGLEETIKSKMVHDQSLFPYWNKERNKNNTSDSHSESLALRRKPPTRSYGDNVTMHLMDLGEIGRDYTPYGTFGD